MKSDPTANQLPREIPERLRELEAMVADAHIIVRDPAGRITFWSRVDEEIYGWTSDEAVGRDGFELLHTELPEARDVLEERVAAAGRWEGEISHRDRTGRRHVLMATWTAHRDADGALAAIIEVNCDITRQKTAERELRARERDFRTFFELNGVGNVIADFQTGRFLTFNPTLCEITGYPAEELARLSGPELTAPEDRERDVTGWREALSRGDAHYSIEKRYVRKNGETVWVSVTSTVIRDEAGEALYAAGVVIDITARQAALAEIEHRVAERTESLGKVNAELDQIRRKFETLIDASPAAIIALDAEHRVTIWNPEAETLFALGEQEVLGRRLLDLPLAWDYPETLEGLLRSCGEERGGASLRSGRGWGLDLEIWSAPYPDPDGGTAGRMLLILDETEKKFLEHALLDAGEREQRRIGQELHDHLAQQLLGAAFGAQALFRDLDRSGSPCAPRAGELARLINDSVLDARNMARGINPIEIDSAGLMSALQELVERTHSGAKIALDCKTPVLVHRPETALHAFRLAQEAVNNALQHAQASEVLIRLFHVGDLVTLQVSDNGTGFATESARDAGVGIGIMKYRAQAIHGELSIHTSPSGGTNVTCTFSNPS